MPLQRSSTRRLGFVLIISVLATLSLPLVLPVPKGEEALTLCYPVVGPVQRFNPDLSDSELARTRAHEAAHAIQCRRDGGIWHFVRRVLPGQRLATEAEAYCAEAKYGVSKGGQARLEFARIQDELREMPWFRRLSSNVLNASLASRCPTIAVAAAREEADWRARRHSPIPR